MEIHGDISEAQIRQIVDEERQSWAAKGKVLGRIILTADSDEIEVKALEKSPIVRTRRITGYLSNVERWNDAKRAELKDREVNGW